MKNRITAVLTALLMLVGLSGFAPANAKRDENPTFSGSIGVVVGKGTGESVYISRNRCCGGIATGPYRYIAPGDRSTNYWSDTDSVYIPAGRDLVYGYHTSYGWQPSGKFTVTGWTNIGTAYYVWLVRD